jgi:hypothetical protein
LPSISIPAAVIGAGAIGGAASIATGAMNAGAMNSASKAQQNANQQALALQKQQFGQTQANLSPYMQAGNEALNGQLQLLGLGGAAQPNYAGYVQGNPDLLAAYQQNGQGQDMAQWGQQHWQQFGQNEGRQVTPFPAGGASGDPAQMQQSAIDQLKTNPLYTSMVNTGDQAVLANASATGGLRSGNTSYNLANLNSQSLAQVYQQMLGNYGSLSGLGANAAAGLGGMGQNFANSGSSILGNIGSAQAGGILGSSGALAGGINGGLSSILNGVTLSKMLGGMPSLQGYGNILGPTYNIPGQTASPVGPLSTSIPQLF